jgi:hypothetical protein
VTRALGTYGVSLTPPPPEGAARQGRRALRNATKTHQRRLTESISSKLCWLAAAANVVLDLGQQRTAHVTGIRRCGSSWACALCAPVIRQRRAGDIDQGLGGHLDRGGGALFVTLTMRHGRRDDLADRLGVVAESLRLLLQGSGWVRRRDRLGYMGSIKAVEVTWGEANGWHPHAHIVFVFDRPIVEADRADLEAWLYGRWAAICEARGFGTPSLAHGIDVRQITTAGDLAGYLTKVDGGWGPGFEMARPDLKRSHGDRLVPVQFLERLVATGEKRWASLWLEYERATFGRASIKWSPGLRAALLPDVDELSDVEAASAEGVDVTLLRALIPAAHWNLLVPTGRTADLLTDFEHVGAWLLTMADLLGYQVAPIEPDRRAEDAGRKGAARGPAAAPD